MTVFDILKITAPKFPDNIAVTHGSKNITYRELLAASEKLASRLSALDLDKGARVALLCENTIEYVIQFFAVFAAGYVVVPLDTSLKPETLGHILKDCRAEVLLLHSKYRRHLGQIITGNSSLKLIICDKKIEPAPAAIQFEILGHILAETGEKPIEEHHSSDEPDGKLNLDEAYRLAGSSPRELAAIFYTSGSTGASKGVMLSHRNLVSNTVATVDYLKLRRDDSVIVILPFYYIYGNSLLLTHILAGARLVIDNRFLYPEVILDTMEKEKVTGFSGVPSNFIILLNNSTMVSRDWPHLRYFTQAGGSMAPEIIRKLIDNYPDKEIYIMYGQTEASPRVSYCPPEKLKNKIGTIGIPVPGVKMTVVDENGREQPPGHTGELVVDGDNVMLGYWNQSEETGLALRDGRLYTGDLAARDDDGYFYITGRKKEILKVGGNRVSAKEIEECLLSYDRVLEAAVIGIPDELLGESIMAVIVTRNGRPCDPGELKNFCKARLADHKVPKYVEFIGSLPKQKTGKVDKIRLKKTFEVKSS